MREPVVPFSRYQPHEPTGNPSHARRTCRCNGKWSEADQIDERAKVTMHRRHVLELWSPSCLVMSAADFWFAAQCVHSPISYVRRFLS
ncbi:hypothetical protein BaRGS_00025053 [Batillaria attramentaria]|uniref:Uncharacterized protein n=1 Tax=Batillaria attramentaria TaxID=370345 RepID=A0ABD0K9I3_9CAEN